MALSEQIKKGGRYTKKEQEERKLQVYHLHFEQEKPAVKIAEMLNVNRNTINDDIRYWHQQLANEMNVQDISAKMTKQIQRIEIQRDRLLGNLEDAESLEQRIKLERFISDIDNRLIGVYSKMIVNGKEHLPPTIKIKDIDEDEIKEFVRDLILYDDEPNSEDVYSEDMLRFDFIRKKKCDVAYADRIIQKTKQDDLFKKFYQVDTSLTRKSGGTGFGTCHKQRNH
jgi:signal transduction histidine kinase